MSAAENKKLMQTIFDRLAAGDRALFVDSLADDVTMTVTGQYSGRRPFTARNRCFATSTATWPRC
jgi:uncharacterized protein